MAALCLLLAAACFCDYRKRKIPNYLVAFIVVLGVWFRLQRDGVWGIVFFAGEAALVMVLFYPVFRVGAVGAGDVKLLGVTAGYLPFEKILFFLFFSMLIAAIISIVRLLRGNMLKERLRILAEYLWAVAKNGGLQLYPQDKTKSRRTGICLSGPVLLGVLLYVGGVY